MPTVKGIPGPYRFYFYSFDCNEPRHVHIQRERHVCKFWLEPPSLGRNGGFPATELRFIQKILKNNRLKILEAWNEHCNDQPRTTPQGVSRHRG
uniref:DUF4160 domain-containing protein n=2 Tax=Candidatus Kentrum TaxID=2126330 RepID=A0A450U9T1_9GAMM|nr:MAG: protein of unknown function (DUF4160) [Candidatus Kentron sp. H]VFJ88858.1 MAG: protein of unknown function (DUF4160) [Candidatus Kentron sp. H]VFJ95106.1 MAG: protein of unknown function (DUF4160) [Candidatus Kentron sp. H]VFK63534.1 MAG: protein of unknown function (DUF4160) [Candidatus Kentron sp. UNK]VFK70857.1 MAG: protein of unknown function (DUF4160) [Candidatus Kentron sp. UNK]